MQARKKLSMFIAITLVLQLFLPIWSESGTVEAAGWGPEVKSLSPATGTSDVQLNSVFTITFDDVIKRNINDLSKTIAIYRAFDNREVAKYPMNDYRVSMASNILTLNPTGLVLENDTNYYIKLEAGAVANEANALNKAIEDPATWSFRTVTQGDSKPLQHPTATNGLCMVGASCSSPLVPITSVLQFQFNKTVTLTGGTITLTSSTDNRDIAVNSPEITGSGSNTISYKPLKPLTPSTTYTIVIASNNIVDTSGYKYAGASWTFTTAASPVQLMKQSPASGAVNVDGTAGLMLELNFDKNVKPYTIDNYGNTDKWITISKVGNNAAVYNRKVTDGSINYSGSKVTINAGALERNTSYYVTIEAGAIIQAGNPSAIYYGIHNATDWVFTTGHGADSTPLTVTPISPVSGSVAVGTNEKIVLSFNKSAYPNSGTIGIYEYNSNALYRSIPVTSDRITGGGSQTITIDPHTAKQGEVAKNFTVATRYYVKFDRSAFKDVVGNQIYSNPFNSNGYNFQVAAVGSAPQIQTISPNNLTTTVATDAEFKITFDKPISIEPTYSVDFIPKSGSGTISANLKIDPKNNRVAIITPKAGNLLAENTEYYINISARSIMDVNGNYFVGILNQYQWSFKTLGGDKTPPTVSKSEVSGNVLRIIYNELLDETSTPTAASFYVTVGGTARNVNSVSVQGNVVSLTLASSVTSAQKVLVSYTKPISREIRDLTKNQAPSFANQAVTSGFVESNPTVTSSSYSGSTVYLGFSDALNTLSNLAYTQFKVTVKGSTYTVNNVTNSGNGLTITLNQTIPANSTVIVSYTAGLFPLTGVNFGTVASFNHTVGTATGGGSGSTAGAPTIQSITLSNNTLYLNYNETLNTSSRPANYQYSILVNGKVVSVTSTAISNNMVVLTLASTPKTTDQIKVTYYSTTSTVLDADRNAAASFNSMDVGTSNQTGGEVTVQGAVLKGDTLTINFSGNLSTSSTPSTDSFLVRIADNSRVVSKITISGSQVIIKLARHAKLGEAATVSYFSQASMLKSAGGITVNGFTNMTVANQTTVLDTLSDVDYGSAANGILLKLPSSTSSNGLSPGGSTTTQYTIATDKLVTAVTTLAASQMKNAEIVFEVPSSQKAAIVLYPIAALQTATKNGDYTLVVNYGDLSYSVPLSSIDLKKAGTSSSNYLRIAFEEGRSNATSSLETAINRSGATIVEGPFAYELTVTNGSTSENAAITGNITRTVKSSETINNGTTTAVFYDEGISAISAVPTTFKSSNGTTTITFKRPGNSAYAIVKSNKTFSDTKSHWAHNSITIMARKFIVEGHSTTNFKPQANITRGEFATYIVKGLGLSANKNAAKQFKDVNSNSVMGGYIGAAVSSGIVSGVSSSSFAPNSYITRQDMALMMVRAAGYAGLSTTLSGSADSILNGYSDKSQLGSYAKTGVATAINLGIISGTTTTKLSPKQNATRAEGTLMIMRLLKKTDSLQY